MTPRNEWNKIFAGIFLVAGVHLVAVTVGGIIASVFGAIGLTNIAIFLLLSFLGIGLAQLLYVVPMVIWLKRRERLGLMKGVIIGAVVTALLNGGCWLLMVAATR